MSPKENMDRPSNGPMRDENPPRNAEARKNRVAKKSESNDDEPIIKTTTRRPKPVKESPIPSSIPRYNPSIRDAKRPDVPPPPVGYMIDDDDIDDGLDSLYDFDSEDMQQTIADRPSRTKKKNQRDNNRDNNWEQKPTVDKKRSEKEAHEKVRDDKKRHDEKPRVEATEEKKCDSKERKERKPVEKPVVKAQPKPAPVEEDVVSDTSNLLAEIKRQIKKELIAELRQQLQDELREELKQELGLGKRPRPERTPRPEPAPAEQPTDAKTTQPAEPAEKKTAFCVEKSTPTDSIGKKKAILAENGVNKQSDDESVELVDLNQKSQGRFKKIQTKIQDNLVASDEESCELRVASCEKNSDTQGDVSPRKKTSSKSEQSDKIEKPAKSSRNSQLATRNSTDNAEKLTKPSRNSQLATRNSETTDKVEKPAKPSRNSQLATRNSETTDKIEKPTKSSRNSQLATRNSETTDNKFAQFHLKPEIMRALNKFNYLEPTPIQTGVIPVAGNGRDVLGQAQTGTGKTAAFSLPILQKLEFDETLFAPRALILVPTRELAVQVRDEIQRLGKYTGLTIAAFYGGAPLQKQAVQLSDGVDIAVGTPGRVIDLFTRKALNLSKLEFVVLDEADRMLDIGFRPDIEKILRRCPDSRQTLLMSATIPPEVDHLARHYMNNPEKLDFSPKNLAVETIEQSYFSVDPERKVELLKRLLERENPHQAIIFCRTKKRTELLTNIVQKWYPDAQGMHGDMEQGKRLNTIKKFRDGEIRFLVATDVVGRGLDISGVSHIVNYDIPQFCDDYVHRVGRTGRMGREGVAFTFVTAEEGVELTRIEMRINKLLKRDEIPGFIAFAHPLASKNGSGTNDSQNESDTVEPPKPVFGQRVRRVRKAL